MNTQAATAKAIDWGKVSRFVLRFAWAAAVLVFKIALIALSFIVRLITSGKNNDTNDNRSNDLEEDEVIHKFGHESRYGLYKNDTRF